MGLKETKEAVEYFFSLYWRNIKGTFLNGWTVPYAYGVDKVTFFAWLGHLLLLPLTLTLGAGIKTIVDCATRVYTSEETVATVHSSIEKMDESDMKRLVNELHSQDYAPASNSSIKMLSQLSQLSTDNQQSETQPLLQDDQKKQGGESTLDRQATIASNAIVNSWRKIKLNSNRAEKVEFGELKANLAAFMADKNNNGKKLFQHVVGFFDAKESKTQAQADNANEQGGFTL